MMFLQMRQGCDADWTAVKAYLTRSESQAEQLSSAECRFDVSSKLEDCSEV